MLPLRIAIAGIAIESSTFSPHRATERDFHQYTGVDLVNRYEATQETSRRDVEWVGVFYARSIPGGAVESEVYRRFRDRIIAGLAAEKERGLDGLFLDIHGAMSVVGMDDAEGDLIMAIREVIGPHVKISASMDLHGNVSQTLVANTDLITCYRMAPHEDAWETKNRAARNLVKILDADISPVRAWVPVPILLPGEKTSTRVEPAKSLYAQIPEIIDRSGVIDASIWVGYAWADEPRCHAVVVVQGSDEEACRAEAERLARRMWDVRREFEFVGPPATLEQAVDEAVAEAKGGSRRPFFISDSGDNPGAGGTGDVTWTLTRLLSDPRLTSPDGPITYVASVFDHDAIQQLRGHQVGDLVDVLAGGRVAPSPEKPARIQGVLQSFHEGDVDAGGIGVIAVGNMKIIVTEFRKAFHATSDFEDLNLPIGEADIVVTKIGYLEPTLYEAAGGWALALTPGGVDQDLQRLGHQRIQRPMFPFDTDDFSPGLVATVF